MSSPGDGESDARQGVRLRKGQRRALVVLCCVAPLFLVLFVGGFVSTVHDMDGSWTTYLDSGSKGGPAWMWLLSFAFGSASMVACLAWVASALVKDSRRHRSTNTVD